MTALLEGMKAEKAEVEAIITNKEEPNFKNTIEALEKSGELLSRVNRVFGCLNKANTNDELQKISKKVAPLLTKHNDDINLSEKLFARIKKIYDTKKIFGLTPEQNIVLENYYLRFVRSGARLRDEDKEKLRSINKELSNLYVKFRQNHFKQTNSIGLVIDKDGAEQEECRCHRGRDDVLEARGQYTAAAFNADQCIGRDRGDLDEDEQVEQVAGHDHAVDAHHQEQVEQQRGGMLPQRRQPVQGAQQRGGVDREHEAALVQA